jgi:hypothetical protein
MPSSKAVFNENGVDRMCILLPCFTPLQIVINLSIINFESSGNFVFLFEVGMIVLNFGLGTDGPGRNIRALSHYPHVVCTGTELKLGHDHLFADPFSLLFTVSLPLDTAKGKKLIVSVYE